MQLADIQMQHLEERLNDWADYYIRGGNTGIGYPSVAAVARLMAQGVVVSNSNTLRTPQMNEAAEEIEELVKKLAQTQPLYADCLRDKYFCRICDYPLSDTKRRSVVQQLALKRGITEQWFRCSIKMAKVWLIEKLEERQQSRKKINKNIFTKRAAND